MHDERIKYRIDQLTETGANVSLALSEDIELEPVSQQQMMLEAVDRAVTDKDVKEQIRPLLEAILKSQPQRLVKTYPQTEALRDNRQSTRGRQALDRYQEGISCLSNSSIDLIGREQVKSLQTNAVSRPPSGSRPLKKG